jgi:Ca2+-binding EF-hand superfamily protein
MKTPFLSLVLSAATLIPAAGWAAEPNPYDEIVKTYDRNGDGKLDEDEKVAAKEAMAMQGQKGAARKGVEERVAKASPEQRAKMLENARARIEEAPGQLRRFDTNSNGKLDDAEWEVAKAEFEKRDKSAVAKSGPAAKGAAAPKGKASEVLGKMLKEHDTNADGRLDETERNAMAAANRARVEGNPRMLRRFDKDGDGKLSDTEWETARAQVGDLMENRKQR